MAAIEVPKNRLGSHSVNQRSMTCVIIIVILLHLTDNIILKGKNDLR